MPQPARPDLPPQVEEAIAVLGNRVRVAILRALVAHGPATKAELHRRLGGSDANLHHHLTALERSGALTADPSRSDEPGPVTRRYHLDQARLRVLLDALSGGILEP